MRAAAIAAAVLLSLAGTAATAAGIRWETKLDRAGDAARDTNQPMLIEFWAVWCEPCKEMDRDVYADQAVAAAMERVIPVRIDIDRDPGAARKYAVSGTPTLIVADSHGRELYRYAGSLPRDRMLRLLEALPGNVRRLNELSAALSAKKNDVAALTAFAAELRASGFYRTSNTYYDRALKTKEGRQPGAAKGAILFAMERNALQLRLYADAVKLCEQALRELAGRPEEAEIRRDLARAREGLLGG